MNGRQELAAWITFLVIGGAIVITLIAWGITSTAQKVNQEAQIIKTCAENGKNTMLDKYENIKGCN